ncbi:MAG: 50S ribosomal protein L29 [Victivallales bacterium]|jgi:large subunit ribosomal protein L29|nr:50S ribosomal protein L29 [Victivallales bacterium]MBR4221199.1 50S ribosomal protein L29 [Victivallales bacterium]
MKPSEIRELNDEELGRVLEESRREMFNLRRQIQIGQANNSARIRLLRKDIARIETEKTARANRAE